MDRTNLILPHQHRQLFFIIELLISRDMYMKRATHQNRSMTEAKNLAQIELQIENCRSALDIVGHVMLLNKFSWDG